MPAMVDAWPAPVVGSGTTVHVRPQAYGRRGCRKLLAGMWELRNGNTFGGTAFTSFGAFWLSLAAYDQCFIHSVPASARGAAVGVYLVGWAVFTAYMWVASLRTTAATSIVFLLLAITFALLGIVNWARASTASSPRAAGPALRRRWRRGTRRSPAS